MTYVVRRQRVKLGSRLTRIVRFTPGPFFQEKTTPTPPWTLKRRLSEASEPGKGVLEKRELSYP
jgi:hypothetical protein